MGDSVDLTSFTSINIDYLKQSIDLMKIDKVHDFIINNDILSAISVLELKDANNKWNIELTNLKARFNKLNKDEYNGIINYGEKRIEENKIRTSLLKITEQIDKESLENFKLIFSGIWARLKWGTSSYEMDKHYINFKNSNWTRYSVTFNEFSINFKENINDIRIIFENFESGFGRAIIKPKTFEYETKDYPATLLNAYIDYSFNYNFRLIRFFDLTGIEKYAFIKVTDEAAFEKYRQKIIKETTPEPTQSFNNMISKLKKDN